MKIEEIVRAIQDNDYFSLDKLLKKLAQKSKFMNFGEWLIWFVLSVNAVWWVIFRLSEAFKAW